MICVSDNKISICMHHVSINWPKIPNPCTMLYSYNFILFHGSLNIDRTPKLKYIQKTPLVVPYSWNIVGRCGCGWWASTRRRPPPLTWLTTGTEVTQPGHVPSGWVLWTSGQLLYHRLKSSQANCIGGISISVKKNFLKVHNFVLLKTKELINDVA